jgi:universal stress protein A
LPLRTSRKKRPPFSKARTARSSLGVNTANVKTQGRLSESAQVEGIALKRILVPVDLSSLSNKAARYAARLARHFGAEVDLLHVDDRPVAPAFDGFMIAPPTRDGNNAQCVGELRRLATTLSRAEKISVRSNKRTGLPGHEIVQAAKDLDVDLIVLGTHGHTGWKHFAIGSTAERVVRAAPCPVLVVREKEHDFV